MKKNLKYCDCLFYSVNALSRNLTRIAEDEFAVTGISPSHAFLLMTVNSNPGIGPSEISELLQLMPSTVTRLIDKMERKGYLTRTQKGRETNVFPTKVSKKLDMTIKAAWRNLHKRYDIILGTDNSKKLNKEINNSINLINNNNIGL